MSKNTDEIFVLPAGTYYIGDLCYVMHDEWDEVCSFDVKQTGIMKLKDGREFCLFYTKYGDGVYYDQYNFEYGVDAGLIGCIKLEDVDQQNKENDITLGNIFLFEEEFTCKTEDGLLCFGHVNIDTDPSYEDNNDDFYMDDYSEQYIK